MRNVAKHTKSNKGTKRRKETLISEGLSCEAVKFVSCHGIAPPHMAGSPLFGFRRPPHTLNGQVFHCFQITHVTSIFGGAGDLGSVRDRILGNS